MTGDDWSLRYESFDPAHERHRETLLTVGNGYMATRGALAHVRADASHYPGTYAAGVYNSLESDVDGETVSHESGVNLPDWTLLQVRIDEGPWLDAGTATISLCERRLDMASGTLHSSVVLEDDLGQRTRIEERRFIHLTMSHLAVMEQWITPENWSGTLELRSSIDADVRNSNVFEDTLLSNRHLRTVRLGDAEPGIAWLESETITSHVRIGMAQRTTCDDATAEPIVASDWSGHVLTRAIEAGQVVHVEKVVAVFTSRDAAIADPLTAALAEASSAPAVDELHRSHSRAWNRLWQRYGIETNTSADRLLRLHWFHVIAAIGPNVAMVDAGIPARGLHGEGYRGHVFWDELFVFPLLVTRYPELGRSLLMYRYRRLPAARRAARLQGGDGSRFPWQSGSDGSELTPSQLYNHRSDRWMPDNSSRQYHVGLAVAWNTWQYSEITGDRRFMAEYGAEILVETARYFAALAERDPHTGRYHLRRVMGPDEFHDGYPDQPGRGVDDNAYTNVMACWLLCRCIELVETLTPDECVDLCDRVGIIDADLEHWKQIACNLHLPFHDGILSQFEGYGQLEELDWEAYRRRYGNIRRLDLILEAEDDTTNRYRASKQPDLLMLFYLFSAEEISSLINHMGYEFDTQSIPKTIEYYYSRCSHGSTLSDVVHAWVLARSDRPRSWHLLTESLVADLDDTQGGTTEHGIHLGAMAGSLDLLQRCYSGMELRDDVLWFAPALPDPLDELRFPVRYRGHSLQIHIRDARLTVESAPTDAAPIQVAVGAHARALASGQLTTFELG